MIHRRLPYLSFIACLLFIFSSCSGSGKFRLTGDFDNLQAADFYIYSLDGSLQNLDTIHVVEGQFEWELELNDEATFYLVYPNLNEQIIFARPGDHVRFKGDANQLRAVSVKGNEENEALTKFRHDNLQVPQDSLNRAMQAYIQAHQDSRVSSYLRRQLTLSRTSSSQLRKGGKLPAIVLPPDTLKGDTLRILPDDSAARPVLLFFWASWKSDSRSAASDIRRTMQKASKLPTSQRLQPISISLDYDTSLYAYSVKSDSINYDRRCYPQLWEAPICRLLNVQTIPYYILADSKRRVLAFGSEWNDVKPALEKLLETEKKP